MSDDDNDQPPPSNQSFGHRHGVTILTTVLFALLALVMIIQMAC